MMWPASAGKVYQDRTLQMYWQRIRLKELSVCLNAEAWPGTVIPGQQPKRVHRNDGPLFNEEYDFLRVYLAR